MTRRARDFRHSISIFSSRTHHRRTTPGMTPWGMTLKVLRAGRWRLFSAIIMIWSIQAKAPFLNVGIAPVPQPTGATISISYPKYNGLAVYQRSRYVISAWQFILTLTAYANGEKIYTDATGNPPALRSAIAADANNADISVFAKQALTGAFMVRGQ